MQLVIDMARYSVGDENFAFVSGASLERRAAHNLLAHQLRQSLNEGGNQVSDGLPRQSAAGASLPADLSLHGGTCG